MTEAQRSLPGTAAFYDKRIYPNLGPQTLRLSAEGHPTPSLTLFHKMGLIDSQQPLSFLDMGCGAGRNLREIRRLFPQASIHGFEGSPLALSMAQTVVPESRLVYGDVHGTWPFSREFDLVLDSTVGISESETPEKLDKYATSLFQAIKPGGYAIIEGIAPEDESSKRFGEGSVVIWQIGEDTKPERLMSPQEAVDFYRNHKFLVIAAQNYSFLGTAFGERDLDRKFFHLILQKPHEKSETITISDFSPVDMKIPQGFTNLVEVVKDNDENLFVKKTQREGTYNFAALIDHLADEELPTVGFSEKGGLVRGRTMQEQQEFMSRTNVLGLPTVTPVYVDTNTLIMPFIQGKTLWTDLQDGNTSAITPALDSLHNAHRQHITYGDRWPGNIIVQKNGTIRHIDFEVAVEGVSPN